MPNEHDVPVTTGDEHENHHAPEMGHAVLPRPTYWPIALAFGITLLAWSLVTSFLIGLAGLAVFVVALAGWIGDLLHEE